MIVYNITTKVEKAISADWANWQIEEHIPEIMATRLFVEYRFFELLEQDDVEATTYVIQYYAETRQQYDDYKNNFAPRFIEKAVKKWGNRFIAFKTTMQSVQ